MIPAWTPNNSIFWIWIHIENTHCLNSMALCSKSMQCNHFISQHVASSVHGDTSLITSLRWTAMQIKDMHKRSTDMHMCISQRVVECHWRRQLQATQCCSVAQQICCSGELPALITSSRCWVNHLNTTPNLKQKQYASCACMAASNEFFCFVCTLYVHLRWTPHMKRLTMVHCCIANDYFHCCIASDYSHCNTFTHILLLSVRRCLIVFSILRHSSRCSSNGLEHGSRSFVSRSSAAFLLAQFLMRWYIAFMISLLSMRGLHWHMSLAYLMISRLDILQSLYDPALNAAWNASRESSIKSTRLNTSSPIGVCAGVHSLLKRSSNETGSGTFVSSSCCRRLRVPSCKLETSSNGSMHPPRYTVVPSVCCTTYPSCGARGIVSVTTGWCSFFLRTRYRFAPFLGCIFAPTWV